MTGDDSSDDVFGTVVKKLQGESYFQSSKCTDLQLSLVFEFKAQLSLLVTSIRMLIF